MIIKCVSFHKYYNSYFSLCKTLIMIVFQDLRPKGHDVLKEELGNIVDKEMIATSVAIEEAVLRMDVRKFALINKDRLPHSGHAHDEDTNLSHFFLRRY